jgi:hypothetical protein
MIVRATAMLAVLALIAPTGAWARAPKPEPAAEILTVIKPGQWVQIEGLLQRDTPLPCTELRQLAGDFLDDDWSLMGRVDSLDSKRGRFMIGPIRVRLAKNAMLEGPEGLLTSVSDLREGMSVEVDGTYLKNGTFLGKEVDDESDDPRTANRLRGRVRMVAKIEHVDRLRRRVTVMGNEFLVTDKTQFKSMLR